MFGRKEKPQFPIVAKRIITLSLFCSFLAVAVQERRPDVSGDIIAGSGKTGLNVSNFFEPGTVDISTGDNDAALDRRIPGRR